MIKTLGLAVLATTALVAVQANADQRWPNWYLGIHGTLAFIPSEDLSVNGSDLGKLHMHDGYGGGAAIGYMPGSTNTFLDGMRFEFAYDYLNANVKRLGSTDIGHDQQVNSFMANAYYDFNLGSGFVPYIGAGIGYANDRLDSRQLAIHDGSGELAWNFMAGIGWAPASVPNTVLTLGYRFEDTTDPKFDSNVGSYKGEFESSNLELGARFAF